MAGEVGAGPQTAGDRGADLAWVEAGGESGGDEGVPDDVVGQVASAHQLSQAEGGAVEGVVANPGDSRTDPSELGVEGGAGPVAGVEKARNRGRRGRSGCRAEDPFGKRSEGGAG